MWTFEESISLIEKIVIFQSVYKNTYNPIKERNAHVKNAIFILSSFMRETHWL